MATKLYSSITHGSTITFNPATDVLYFDAASISAASIVLSYAADFTTIKISTGAKNFYLPPGVSLTTLTTSNVTFADGSQWIVGDNSDSTNDSLANTLIGTVHHDRLLGLEGNDTLIGESGNDVLDGGNGADIMKGGFGADTYVVDNVNDVVNETPTIDPLLVITAVTGDQGNGDSEGGMFSADGRYVVFDSGASNLVAGDTNNRRDAFVKDLQTGAIRRVSTNAAGNQSSGDESPTRPHISADGRYVAFNSDANLVVDDNGYSDVFVKDLQTGAIQLISTSAAGQKGNGNSFITDFSSDGRYVVFTSYANNLVVGDTNNHFDVFIKDLQTGTIQRISTTSTAGIQSNGISDGGNLSSDGRYVLFRSDASNLVASDTNGVSDIFVKDLQTGAIQRISTNSNGNQGNQDSYNAHISADGRSVVFESMATNLDLTTGDTNGTIDIFIKDLPTGAIGRISTDSAGNQSNSDSRNAQITADGRYVLFRSAASNLVAGDTNGISDIFIKDLQSGAIQRVSTDAAGNQSNIASYGAQFSTDGLYILFESAASNLVPGDTNLKSDIIRVANPFLNINDDGSIDTVLSSVNYTLPTAVENLTLTGNAAIDGMGNTFINDLNGNSGANRLYGYAGNDNLDGAAGNDTLDGGTGADVMVGGTGNDTYMVDNASDQIQEFNGVDPILVSTTSDGVLSNGHSYNAQFSPDGRYVLFTSEGSNLVAGDTNNNRDIFVKDLQTGSVQRVSTDAAGNQSYGSNSSGQFSANGRYVLFDSGAYNLVTGDTNGANDIFVKDLQNGSLQRVSIDAAGNQGNDSSYSGQFSANGRYILFMSRASNLVSGDTNGANDIFVKDLQTGVIRRVSTDAEGNQSNGLIYFSAQFSTDGRYMLFISDANNLVSGDTNGAYDIFVKDLQTGAIRRVSTDASGNQGNYDSYSGQFSADGRYVLFGSAASNLVAGGTNGATNIFIKDLQTGAVQRVSTDAAGNQSDGSSYSGQFSNDGRYVLFTSDANNLVNDDTNGATDIFIKDLQTGSIRRVSTDAAGNQGNDDSNVDPNNVARFSADGRYVLFDSLASNLVVGDTNYKSDIFRVLNPFLQSGGGTDSVQSSISHTLADNVENLTLTGDSTIDGTGNELANQLIGNAATNVLNGSAGDDTLDGGAGLDTLYGGDGNDYYYLRDVADFVFETNATSTGGTDTVFSYLSTYTLTANVENARIITTNAANLTGNNLNNFLYAGSGNNVITGGDGNDTVSYYYVVSGSTGVKISLATTTAQSTGGSGSDTLNGIEHLRGSNNADQLTGNTGNNRLEGYAGDDAIDGGVGLDTLIGGDGNDYYYMRDVGDVITETNATPTTGGIDTVFSFLSAYILANNIENGRIISTGAANLTGNSLNNFLYAGSGNNVITGGDGNDTVSYYYAVSGSTGVKVSLAKTTTAQSTGGSGSDTLNGIEHLRGSNNADQLTGNTGNNRLEGYAGDDSIDGGAGLDTLIGGDGNDYYYLRDVGDVITETNATASTGGIDTVFSFLSAYILANNIENGRIISTGAANLTGNSLNNFLYAGSGNNVITGGDGNDTVSYYYAVSGSTGATVSLATTTAQNTGGSGSDTLNGIEHLRGSNNADQLTGNTDNNRLEGYGGNDTLIGGEGIDTLVGGDGKDNLSGGNGNDVFDFNSLNEMGVTNTTRDIISDFIHGQDKIDLSTLDANTSTTANDAFDSLIVGSSFSGAFSTVGDLYFDTTAKVLYGNVDADASAEFSIQLTGVIALAATDILM